MAVNSAANNKRIAKNTLMLYIRMLLIMLVTLYTSRIVLKTIGVEDYGIYNVVGGVVTMLSFLNSSLNTATQRFLNYEMGKNNLEALNKVFSISFISFSALAVIIIILAETVGLWFVSTQLVIPAERMNAALWTYHLSVLTFAVNMLVIPYTAAIIANEHMNIYAYISIIEITLKLGLVFLLTIINYDKLILYAVMMLLVACIVTSAYRGYCIKKFNECHFKWVWDSNLFKKLFSFSGWMLAGTSSNLLSTQGVNILINMYFGPALNAARAVAMQVYSAVNSFSQNFMTAVRPQIIKSYAQEDFRYMYRLVFTSSKLCFFLLFIISLPIILEADIILKIWLKNVPEFSVLFTRLVLIDLLIQVSFTPIAYVSQAADKTRGYQLSIATCFLAIFFISWGAYKVGLPVYATFIIAMIVDIIGLFVRLFILKKLVDFPIISYIKKVIVPILIVFLLSVGIITLIKLMVPETHVTVICVTLLGILIQCVFIWYIGLDASERNMTYSFVKSGLSKIRKK